MAQHADIVVIGGGAAGLSAARAARRGGASVVLIERNRLGGDCTWVGCVPSKALIERARAVWGGRTQGLTGDVDFAGIMEDVHKAVTTIFHDEDQPTLERQGITVLEGQARFTAPRRLSVDGTEVVADRGVVVATGSRPLVPPIEGLREASPLTNETVFELRTLPRRLAVLGGGPIGLELGQAFARLGSTVTVLEGADRLAGREEPEASQVIEDVLVAEGVQVVTGSFVERVETTDGTHTVTTKDGRRVEADAVLAALGRRPITDGLDLDRAGIELTEQGAVKIDDKLRTTAEGVLAIGDCTMQLPFTHVGDEMGRAAVKNILGRIPSSFDTQTIPWATFTEPEIGRVGKTEAEAHAEHGSDARVAYLPLDETDRGRASGHTEGFVKLITAPRGPLGHTAGGALVGATVMCPSGGDVIHEVVVLMRAGAFAGRLAQAVHAYPSWSLAVRQCAAQFFYASGGREARPARGG